MKRFLCFIGLLACSAIGTNGQAIVALSPVPAQQFFSTTGAPLASGCIYTYITQTATPLATYVDGTGLTVNGNPIILDAGGYGNIWLTNASYRFTIYSKGVGGVIGTDCFSGGFQRTVDAVSAWSVINQPANLFLSCASSDPSGSAGELGCRSDLGNKGRYFSTLWDSIVTENSTATLANKTISSGAYSGAQTGFVGTSPVLNSPNINGTVVTGPPATYLVMANDIATGTTLNKLSKINPTGLAGFAILPLISDTGGITGIVVAGAGNSGNATIQQNGSASCVFDNAVTSGDYVQISPTVAGDCHDSGVAYPSSGQVLGRVLATNVAAGTYLVDFFGPEIKSPPNVISGVVNLTTQAANIGATTIITTSANGFYRISCYVIETQAATTSSTLPACNYIFTDGDSSFVETIPATFTSGANTVGSFGAMATSGPPNYSFFAKSGTVIQYSTTGYLSSGGTVMQYALHIRLEGPF